MASGRESEPEEQAQVSCERRGSWFIFGSPAGFEWNRIRLPLDGLAEELNGLRIIHLSDLHLRGSWSRGYDELIARIDRAAADLLLITGDFVDDRNDHRSAIPVLKKLVPRLKARLGAWAILGNHDADVVGTHLLGTGVNVIDGRVATLESASGARLELIGLPGVAKPDLDPHFIDAIPPKRPKSLRIVLSHYPDNVRRIRPLSADLFLTGHTHGGQCCLPGGLPIITHDSLPRRWCKGVHRYESTWMVISRGFGFAGIPLRVFCPNEVAEITLCTSTKEAP